MSDKANGAFVPSKAVTYWLWSGIVLILIMVVIGGMTRLTHSGLSMVHWSFTGSMPPMNEAEWVVEFEKYQSSPEYKELHSHFELADFKSIFWWEYIHRMFGRLIGAVFIIPFAWFLFRRRIPKKMIPQFLTLLGLGAFQALLGWFMVKSGLVDVPRVSHYRLAAHLTTAFITCAYILWVVQDYQQFGRKRSDVSPWRKHTYTLGGLLLLQIIFGAFVAGLRAGWVHNTWPLMDGDLVAPAVTALEPVIMNFLEGKSGVQFMHRTVGLLVTGYALWLAFFSKAKSDARMQSPFRLIALFVFVQFILGVTTLLLKVPISLAVLHQVFALVVLLSVIWAIHRSTYTTERS